MTKVTIDRALIEQAVDAIRDQHDESLFVLRHELRKALAEPAVEPVAWVLSHSQGIEFSSKYPMQESRDAAEQMARQHMGVMTVTPLYTTPQPPAERDVCKIMLEVVPGADGMGHEVYAKNVSEVVNKLTEMGQRIEDLEGASPPAEPARTSQDVCTVPLLSDDEIIDAGLSIGWVVRYMDKSESEFARAIEQLVRRKAGL